MVRVGFVRLTSTQEVREFTERTRIERNETKKNVIMEFFDHLVDKKLEELSDRAS